MNTPPVTIVLLRGLSREHRHWGGFPELLQGHYPEARILCPDLPGNGEKHRQKSALSINETLQSLRADLKGELPAEPVHLIALSLGGMVAMQWMTQFPEEISSAVLMSSSFKGLSPFYQRLRPGNYMSLLRAIFSRDIQQREETILRMTSQQHLLDKQLIQQWVCYAQQNPVSRLNVLRQLLAASRYVLPQQKPQSPVLLLSGEKDQLVNPQCSADLSYHWDLTLQSNPVAGHDLSLDDEQWVYKQVCHWFDGL